MVLGSESANERKAISLAHAAPFHLGDLEVSPATRQLRRGSRSETLEPRIMQVLVALAQAQGAVVSRDDLIATCWDGRIVGDNAIQRTISRLRELSLGLGAGCFRLETVNKVGYRLIALEAADATSPVAARATTAHRRSWPYVWAGASALAVLAGLLMFTLTRAPASDVTTIAIDGGRGRGGAEFAAGLAGDLAHLAAARPGGLAFANGAADPDYRLAVAIQPGRGGLQADVSLFRRSATELLWSAAVSAPANEPLLRERAANAIFRVARCALKTNGNPSHSDNEALRLAFSACERLDEFNDGSKTEAWRRVVAHDPHNWRALATLALQEAIWADEAPSLTYMNAREQALLRSTARMHLLRARAAEPSLGLSYAAEAALVGHGQFAQEFALLDRGLAADPDCAELHILKASALQDTGRMDDARDEALAATELEPSSSLYRADLVLSLAYAGYKESAIAELQSAERLWPDSNAVREARQSFEFRFGDASRLLRQMDQGAVLEPYSSRNAQRGWMHAYLLARASPTRINVADAMKALSAYPVPQGILQSIVHLGRIDAAYAYANRPEAIAGFRSGETYVLFRAYMRPFLFDRRFMAFANRIGLLRYWQTSGAWPDFCQSNDLPYNCKAEARRLHPPKAA